MLVQITRQNIRESARGDPYDCPISNALREIGHLHAFTYGKFCSVKAKNTGARIYYLLPFDAWHFMDAYDNRIGKRVKPITFTMYRVKKPTKWV